MLGCIDTTSTRHPIYLATRNIKRKETKKIMLANILAVGLMGTAMALSPMQPRYVVDNQNETLTFSAEELNNNKYEYLAEQLRNLDDEPMYVADTSITYNNKTFTYDELDSMSYLNYTNGDEKISMLLNNENTWGNWTYYHDVSNEEEATPFTASMTINNAEWFIANIEEPPSLTLSKYDLNNNKYTYLAEQLNTNENSQIDVEITYNSHHFSYNDLIENEYLEYSGMDVGNTIRFILEEQNNNYGKWMLYNHTGNELVNEPFTASMTINNAEWYLENMYAPLDSGDMMTAITSGLPLMASLAQAFLNGFTSIFWNSTTNTLTTFSNFALIMLSVAIVFACIKLVLNLVRSNTGV